MAAETVMGMNRARLRQWAPLIVLVGLCVVVGSFNANFFTAGNFVRLVSSAAIPIVLCMGATFIILMGSIDLSVEGVVAMAAVFSSLLVTNSVSGLEYGLWAACAVAERAPGAATKSLASAASGCKWR